MNEGAKAVDTAAVTRREDGIGEAEIRRRFEYHAPDGYTLPLHEAVRATARSFATFLDETLPGTSREKSLAFTALEEALFWANAHLARNVTGRPPQQP